MGSISWIWSHSLARMGEDWIFLALLGIIMAFISYVMDKGISMCTNGKLNLYYITFFSTNIYILLYS